MQNFKNFRGACPRTPLERFLFLNQLQNIGSAEKNTFGKNVEIVPPSLLKFFATSLSAVYQHFFNEGSKFCSKDAVKDSQDCDSVIPLNTNFVCFLQVNYL